MPTSRTSTSLLVLFALLACPAIGLGQPTCRQFNPGVSLGTVQSNDLTEISGIATSRRFANVLWAHDDSGDLARVFALTTGGAHLGIFTLGGATNVDWEDMAIGPGPVGGQDYLYLSDTGNNSLGRSVVTVYRVAEPALDTFQLPVTTSIGGVAAFPMQYPSGTRRDAETLLVDPVTGDWLIVTRDRSQTGTTYVYLYLAPQQAGVVATLQLVATISSSVEIKGGDVSPAGDWLILRTHSLTQPVNGLLWHRATGADIESVFASSPCSTPFVFESQGEAVAFAPDGNGYYTVGEGAHQPIYFYGALTPPAAPGNATASALSSTQVRVTWTDNAGNETGHRVERSTDGVAFAEAAALGANVTTYTDSGRLPSTTYWYRIVAYNEAGTATSNVTSVTTPAASPKPSAPTGLTATANSASQITLRWTDTSSNETGFRIERSSNGVQFSLIGTVGANVTSVKSSNLLSNRIYYYRVRAYNAAGNSSYSNVASARTLRR